MPASLRGSRSARSVLLRMAADQDRAERIRKLKADNPGLTWRAIAEHVGVSERAAVDWAKRGGITRENAEKLAELLLVDPDYIWRGNLDTPDPFVRPASNDDLAGIREEFHARVDHVELMLERNFQALEAIYAAITEGARAGGFALPKNVPANLADLRTPPSDAQDRGTRHSTGSPGRARRQAS